VEVRGTATPRKPSDRFGPADPLRSVGACGSGVPEPALALSVHQALQPCPSPSTRAERVAGLERTRRAESFGGSRDETRSRPCCALEEAYRSPDGKRPGRNGGRIVSAFHLASDGSPGGLKGRGAVAWPERALSERRRSEDIAQGARACRGLSRCLNSCEERQSRNPRIAKSLICTHRCTKTDGRDGSYRTASSTRSVRWLATVTPAGTTSGAGERCYRSIDVGVTLATGPANRPVRHRFGSLAVAPYFPYALRRNRRILACYLLARTGSIYVLPKRG